MAIRLQQARMLQYQHFVAGVEEGYSAEAQQFFDRISDPGTTRKNHYATLIDALVDAGVWAKLDYFYVFAAASEATAITSLISATFNGTSVNSPTFTTDVGMNGNGSSSYVDTNFNPSTASSPKFVQDNASCFVWCNTAAGSGQVMGYLTSSGMLSYMRDFGDFSFLNVNDNSAGVSSSLAVTDARALHTWTRLSSTSLFGYYNTTKGADAGGTSDPPRNENVGIGHAANTYTTRQIMAAGVGSQFSDANVSALYAALHTYLIAVAGISY